MAFRFSLQMLLRLQKSVERQQELLLQAANARVRQANQQIQEIDAWVEAYRKRRAEGMDTGLRAAEIHFDERCREVLKNHRQYLADELSRREKIREDQRGAFEAARRAREVTDSLRERKMEAYRIEEQRREQRRMDDLFILRHIRERSE
jgi:flagellar export protein FliJ